MEDQYELVVSIEEEEEYPNPTTGEELEAMFETNVYSKYKKKNITFSVNKGETGRNEDKCSYFKYYPNCDSTSKIDNDQEIYRIMFDKPLYTDHDGKGVTPHNMNSQTKKMLKAGLLKKCESKEKPGLEVYTIEELKLVSNKEMGTKYEIWERPKKKEKETDEEFKEREKEELAKYDEKIKKDVEEFVNKLKYDGKR